MEEADSIALKSQFGLNHQKRPILPVEERKSKRRVYKKKSCPITGCSKVVVRIENHLRATHKIKDDRIYKKYLKMARDQIVEQFQSSESEPSEESESETEYRRFQAIVHKEGKEYAKKFKNIPVDSADSDDDDWFLSKAIKFAEKKSIKGSLI